MQTPEPMTEHEAQQIFDYVIGRAVTDMAFRRALLEVPKETLEKELAIALPDRFNIRFVENEGADLTIVLPDPDAAELPSGEWLDGVTGGVAVRFFEGLARQFNGRGLTP